MKDDLISRLRRAEAEARGGMETIADQGLIEAGDRYAVDEHLALHARAELLGEAADALERAADIMRRVAGSPPSSGPAPGE